MKKLALIFVCIFFLNGCSVKLAYNFLDFIVKWRIGQYVSLEGKQDDYLDHAMNEFHRWHRHTQLPLYADYIESVLPTLRSKENITGEWIHAETDKVQELLDISLNTFLPIAVNLVHTFSHEQTQQVLENLSEKREKFADEYVDISEKKQYKQRKHDLTDHIGRFFGRFTDEQKALLDDWAKAIRPFEIQSLEQQVIWAQRVSDAMAVRDDKVQLRARLGNIVLYRTDDWDPKLQATLDYNQDITYVLLANLVNSQTDKQRQRMLSKLEDYSEDLRQLAAKAH